LNSTGEIFFLKILKQLKKGTEEKSLAFLHFKNIKNNEQ
jgi:hypothetical protein